MVRLVSLSIALALASTAGVARADGPPGLTPSTSSLPPPPPGYRWQLAPAAAPAEPPVRWYRGQMLVADTIALGLGAVALAGADSGGGYRSVRWSYLSAALAFAASGPIVHGFHHDGIGAADSLALRLGLPLLGAVLGAASQGTSCSDGCGDTSFGHEVVGGMLGIAAAIIIDDAFLAHERPAERPGWTPVLAPMHGGGATVGIGGAF